MAFRRDKFTSGVETFDLLEMLEIKGEKYALDDLRFLEGRSTAEQEKLIRNWMSEKVVWFQKLPQLLEKVERGADPHLKTIDLLRMLREMDETLQKDVETAKITISELLGDKDGQLGKALIAAVKQLEEERGRVYQEIHSRSSELSDYLQKTSLNRLLQDEKVIAEVYEEGK